MKQSQTLEICILWDDNPSLIRPPRLSYALIIAGKRLRVTAFRADCSPHNSRISSWKTLFSFSIPRCCGRISPQVRLGRDRGQLGHHPPKNGTRRAAARSKERKKKGSTESCKHASSHAHGRGPPIDAPFSASHIGENPQLTDGLLRALQKR